MPSVRQVLEQIGDKPLIQMLKERGYHTFSSEEEMVAHLQDRTDYLVTASPDVAREWLEEEGYYVFEIDVDIEGGFELYRNRRTEQFRQWLRDLFWQTLGRIA